MAKKSRNKSGGYKNKAQTAKKGKGKQGNKPRNTKGTSKRTTPQKQQPVNIYIVNEKDKGGKREDKRVEEREEQAAPSKSWLDYFREWRDARLAKKQEKEQKKRVKELKASTKKVKKGTSIVKVHKPAANNAGGVKHRSSSGGGIFRVLKAPLIVVLCIALLATVVYLINTKTGNKEGDWPWNIHGHYDKDGDHWCDKKGCGKCIPVDEDEDGYCDICNACIHIDEDGDCVCDRCDNEYHEDENRNNECDNCGKEHLEPTNAEVAVKAVGDFFYNVTDKTFGAIRAGWDWTKDTFKDIGERIASVMPDWMLKERSDNGCEHIDENGNGVCDECLRRFREKEDTSCVHVDADNSGRCDICDAIITGTEVKPDDGDCTHVDVSPKDGKCDKCGNKVTEGDDSDNTGGNEGETPDEPETPDECTHRDVDDNSYCDYCGEEYDDGVEPNTCIHIDTNGDKECDLCGFTIPDCLHRDANDDLACDYCGDAYNDGDEPTECRHRDANDDGFCDGCGDEYDDGTEEPAACEHVDENKDNFCDNCGLVMEDGDGNGSGGDGGNDGGDDNEGDGNEGNIGDGTGGMGGNEGDDPDVPQEPDMPDCTHRDADDDGYCDVCGDTYEDGDEPTDEPDEPSEPECEHRDADDDGDCDVCGDAYEDGCDFHVDADDNVECDKCGDEYEDGLNPEICEHRDLDDDKDCDICWIEFDDGCNHRDADDDGACDKCGDEFSDGCNNHIDVNVVNGHCDICYRTIDEDCEHQDVTEDGYCDTCNVAYDDGCDHKDTDKNRHCDKCGLYCLHRDEDDNNYCDGCKMVYWDGYNPANCSHYDDDDDGYCDRCKIEYDDGCTCVDEDSDTYCDKCESCMHRDANDDKKCDRCETYFDDGCNCRDEDDDNYCDKCDEFYNDGCEHVPEGEACGICGQSLMTGDLNSDGYDDSINGGYWDGADCFYVYSSVSAYTDQGYYMEDLTLVSYVSNGPFMHNTIPYRNENVDDSLIYFTFGICDADGTVEDMAGIIYTASRSFESAGYENTEGSGLGMNYKSVVSELTWGEWITTRGLGSFTDDDGVTWYKVAEGTYMTVGAETGTVYIYGGGSYVSTLHLSLSAEYTSYEITADERIGNYVYYITTVYGLSMEVI